MLKRLALTILLLLATVSAARAMDITVAGFTISNNHNYSGTITLRIYYTNCKTTGFLDSNAVFVPCGTPTGNWYKQVSVSLASNTLTIPSFVIPSTDDSSQNNVVANAAFFVNNTQRDFLFRNYVITRTLGSSISFAQLYTFNQAATLPNPQSSTYLTAPQVAALIAESVGSLNKATNSTYGIVKLDVAAADPAQPIVPGINSPLLGGLQPSATKSCVNYVPTYSDKGKLLAFLCSSAGTHTLTLTQDAQLTNGYFLDVQNLGNVGLSTASNVSITLGSGVTLDGALNALTLLPGQGVRLFATDAGATWFTQRGVSSSSSGGGGGAFTPVCSGSNDTAVFSAIISLIGSNDGTISLPATPSARCAINSLTIPSNVTLDNSVGRGISINTGQTLTHWGPTINPDGKQIWFNALAGQGTVSFANSQIRRALLVQEWGGIGDGVTNNLLQLDAMTAAAKTGARHIHFLDGTYVISHTWLLSNFQGFNISASNPLTTQLKITGTNESAFYLNQGSYGEISNLGIIAGATSTNASALWDLDSTSPLTITGATNANPIVITTSVDHRLSTGDSITIYGALGNTAANGSWTITKLSATTFSIPTAGNGAYTGGASATSNDLKTQQITLRNLRADCHSYDAAVGFRISKSGGSAQGDTILVDRPIAVQCSDRGISVGYNNAQNALGITIQNGDIQGCYHDGIGVTGGQIFVNNTSMQNQGAASIQSADGILLHQVTTGGADLHIYSGAGSSSISSMTDIRSESTVLLNGVGGAAHVRHASVNGGDTQQWSAGGYYDLGALIHGTPGAGQKGVNGRTFMLVSQNPSTAFIHVGNTTSNSNIVDLTATYTPGAFVGKGIVVRYPNAVIEARVIGANTDTTITPVTAFSYIPSPTPIQVCGYAQTFDCIDYRVVDLTDSTEPTWNSAATGYFNGYTSNGNGWSITQGTNTINSAYYSFGSAYRDPAVNDYIMVVGAGTNGGPFISRVTAFSHPTGGTARVTVADNAVTTVTDSTGYISTPIADGGVKWIDVPFFVVSHGGTLQNLYANGGQIGGSATGAEGGAVAIIDSYFNRPDFAQQTRAQAVGGPIVERMANVCYKAGDYNTGPTTCVPDYNFIGFDVASANTIVPERNVFTLTGTTTVKTITATSVTPGSQITMITTSAVPFDETGNIDIAGGTTFTSSAGQAVTAVWDGTKWRIGTNASTLNGATFAAPGTIGGTTPGAITGTTITANTGFVGPHNGTVGATTPAAGTFTTAAATTSLTVGSGTAITKVLRGTFTVDPASINATTFSSQTFTLTGAASGDSIIVNPPAAGLTSGIFVLQYFVSAADTVTICFYNSTGGAIDLASASWNYQIVR